MKPIDHTFFDSLNSISLSKGDLSVLPSTKDFQRKIFELIGRAEKRIYITALYLQDDAAGIAVLTAIYEAKQKNPQLDVKIFVDFLRAQRGLMGQEKSIGNVRLYRELNERYTNPVEIYGVPVKTREFLGVLHLKGFVFDDQVLYSGASINDIYLHYGERYRADRYHLINSQAMANTFVDFVNKHLITSNAVKRLTADNIPSIKALKPAVSRQKSALRKAAYQCTKAGFGGSAGDIKLTPLLGFGLRKNQLNKAILQLVKQAEKEVVIYTPYFNLPGKVYRAMLRLLGRNGKVTLVVGDKKANDFFIQEGEAFDKAGLLPYIYESNLKRFLKKCQPHIDAKRLEVHLWVDQRNSFHLKGINSDQTNYLLTGHNLNPRAWRLDLENGILIQDPKQLLIEEFDQELDRILVNCTKIGHFDDIDDLTDYPIKVRKLLKNMKRTRFDKLLNQWL